jgi:hypothetical protein
MEVQHLQVLLEGAPQPQVLLLVPLQVWVLLL